MGSTSVQFTVSIADDIPAPHSSRRRPYRQIVQDVLMDGSARELNCATRSDAKAVYAGVMRAISKKWPVNPHVIASTRTLEDGTVSVFVERG